MGRGSENAAVTYDLGTNTIFLEDGTNTLVSIYNEIVTTQVVIPAKAGIQRFYTANSSRPRLSPG